MEKQEKKRRGWTELALSPQDRRWNHLSAELNDLGCYNCYESSLVTHDTFEETLQLGMKKYEGIRIGSPFGEIVTRVFTYEPAMMMSLGCADSLVEIQGKWWTRSALYEAFHHLLRLYGEKINIGSSALVVGAGAAARAVVAALVKVGFKNFCIANQFIDEGLSIISDFKRVYFGVKFEFIPVTQLIMLPAKNSILVNTTPNDLKNDLIQELLYFNFLEPGGVVWDLNLLSEKNLLLQEAKQLGTEVIDGFEIASWVDMIWVNWTFGWDLDRSHYLKKMRENKEGIWQKK